LIGFQGNPKILPFFLKNLNVLREMNDLFTPPCPSPTLIKRNITKNKFKKSGSKIGLSETGVQINKF